MPAKIIEGKAFNAQKNAAKKVEANAVAKVEAKKEVKAVAKVEAKKEVKAVAKVEAKKEAKVEAKKEAKVEAKKESEADKIKHAKMAEAMKVATAAHNDGEKKVVAQKEKAAIMKSAPVQAVKAI